MWQKMWILEVRRLVFEQVPPRAKFKAVGRSLKLSATHSFQL